MGRASKQPKSRSRPARRKGAAKKNGAAESGANGAATAVGTVVELSKDDGKTLLALKAPLAELQRRLGDAREQYLRNEATLAGAIRKASDEYQTVVLAVARKRGLTEEGQSWHFEADTMSFTRTA